jgi:hypothetical protein
MFIVFVNERKFYIQAIYRNRPNVINIKVINKLCKYIRLVNKRVMSSMLNHLFHLPELDISGSLVVQEMRQEMK